MKFPVYQLVINEDFDNDLEVDAIALVDAPAIEKSFMAFGEKMRFNLNEDRQIISGPAMIADLPIYRRNQEYGEHYIVFTADQIALIAHKFLNKGLTNSFNILHDPDMKVDSVSVLNSFVTDSEMGILPMKGFEDAPSGSWFVSARVSDPALWAKIKDGTLHGFSVEGMFKYKTVQEDALEEMAEMLKSIAACIPAE